MTPLGKMLAIFVFLVALVWAWLTVNTFVSRTNWRAEAERAQKQASATADAHEKLRLQTEAERAATKSETESVRRDRDAALATVSSLSREVAELKVKIADELAKANAANPMENDKNSRQLVLQKEVDNLTASLKTAQDTQVKLTKEMADAKIQQEQAQRGEAAQKQRADGLEGQLRTKDDKLQEALARLKAGVGEGVAVRPSAPEGFRGTVHKVGTTGEFVEITPGGGTGLRAGTRLRVMRYDLKNAANSKFVGFLTVRDEIEPDRAAAQFEPLVKPRNKALSADDFPKVGDEVVPDTK